MSEIRFDYECWEPFGEVEVIANEDGSGILIINKLTDDEIDFDLLRDSDQSRIKAQVKDEADYLRDMQDMKPEPHPADDAFGPSYVDWINQQPKG